MDGQRYSNPAIILHWLMAIMILGMIVMGLYMVDLPKGSDERSWFFQLHKSIGLTLGLLAICRLAWKIKNPAPPLPEFIAPRNRIISTATHHTLYLLMFIQPLSGYLSSSFSGYKTKFWGIPLYNWGWKSPELNELFTLIHDISAYCLIALIVLHIAGFCYHMYRKEFELIKRMWFT